MSRDPDVRRWEVVALAGAAVLACALRLPLLLGAPPGGLEESIPFWKAWQMWGWAPPHHLDFDPHFFKYPSLVFYAQFLGQALRLALLRMAGTVHSALEYYVLYRIDDGPYFATARAVTTVFGLLTLWPAWALARRAAGPRAAAATAFLLAIHPTLIARSLAIEVDVPLTCFTTWGLLLAVGFLQDPTPRAALAMGLVAGLATSSKYPGLMLLAPAALAIWMSGPAQAPPPGAGAASVPPTRPRGRGAGRPLPARAVRGPARPAGRAALAILFACGLAGALLATSPYLALDPAAFLRDLADERQHMALGHFGLAAGPAAPGYARDWFAGVMGWPLGIASLAGLALFALRRRPWAWVLAAFFLPYAAIVGSWRMQAERYLVPLVPIGVVAATALVEAAAGAVRGPRWRAGLAAVAGTALLAGPLAAALPARFAALRPDTRTLAKRWIEGHLPRGCLLACEAYGPDLFVPLDLAQLAEAEPAVRAELKRRGYRPRLYAVLDLPLFQVAPERSAKFYSTDRCGIADAVVVTSSVRDRYRSAPARFAPQLAFYDSLEARWPRIAVFRPRGGPGPEIVIYRNPRNLPPFCARGDPGPLDSTVAVRGEVTGAEGAHYLQLGLDYETFGFVRQAEESYLLALRFGGTEPGNFVLAATSLSRCLWRQGRRQAAVTLLEETAARAPGPREAAWLRDVRTALVAAGSRPGAAPGPGAGPPPRP